MTGAIVGARPRLTARLAGFFWLMTFLTGVAAMVIGGRIAVAGDPAATAARILAREPQLRLALASNLVATACYVAATLFVYELLKPVNRRVSLLAAFFSLVGCAAGALSGFLSLAPLFVLRGGQGAFTAEQLQVLVTLFRRLNGQAANSGFLFFGLHCLLVGVLVLRSTFMPRIVGVLMVLAGLGWMSDCLATLLAPSLGGYLSYLMLPGALGEGVLTLWLLFAGVDARRWMEQADGRA